MNINARLSALRASMISHHIDAYIIPSSDPHNSEYVADCWKSREWISGFSGSAGVVVVTQEHAGVWTDSRYFIQGEQELSNSEFELHKVYDQFAPQHIKWLAESMADGSNIGFDGMCFTKSSVDTIHRVCSDKGFNLISEHDLLSEVWEDRPTIPTKKVFRHTIEFAGKSSVDKIKEIQDQLSSEGLDGHFVTSLDDIAWIFNIRGKDVTYNPVAISYALITTEKATLFVDSDKVEGALSQDLESEGIHLEEYADIRKYLNNLPENETYLLDPNNCNFTLYNSVNANVKNGKTISRALKAIKNETEVAHMRTVMAKDGAALAKAFSWLEETIKNETVSEYEYAQKLAECRGTQDHYRGESFGAIVGYRGNGAIIHYGPKKDTSASITTEGILLVDSGGQYLDGTTDITRTISLGTPSDEEKTNFTLVLKGMIALTRAKFPEGTVGAQLDILARQFLWQHGLNFLHGTGHGVGFFLNVHEAPQGFAGIGSSRGTTIHKAGMITSNEPGYYKEGAYGIRIENLILSVKNPETGFLEYETLTLFPIDRNLMDLTLLESAELQWINNYHEECYEKISPYLDDDVKAWLKNKCRIIENM